MSGAFGRRLIWSAMVLALPGGAGAHAGSVVLVSGNPGTNDGTLSAVASLGSSYAKAVGFTMGSTSYDLTSVILRLAEQPGSTSTLSLALYGGTPSGPSGAPLVTFNTPSIPSVASDVTFLPTTSLVLQSGSTYWLEASGQSNTLNGIVWYASNPSVMPTGMATSEGALFTSNFSTQSSLASSGVLNMFEVLGTPTPQGTETVAEPASLIQGGLGAVLALLCFCWRRARLK
jgi:hypothetical protein